MIPGAIPSRSKEPRPAYEEASWVVGCDGATDPGSASVLSALDELERLMSIGTTPGIPISDGDRRVGIGRKGWSRWRELIYPCGSGSVAYARMSARGTMFAWMVDDVSWNLRFEIDARGRRPSILEADEEMRRRLSFARSIIGAACRPNHEAERMKVARERDAVMRAAAAQASGSEDSVWHQDERVLGGMDGMAYAPEGSLRLSAAGRRALDALPSVLHMEHRSGTNPFKTRKVETVNLYATVSLCMDAGDAMERLRALATIPEGEVWWTR